ncbi:MAG TPA: c-type cytochrome [Stellaceae bacterium]|nr:c-type cytochrome [Stellaceae bacterium]
MRHLCILFVSLLVLIGIVAQPATAQSKKALVARGSYLVRAIVACDDCHTPKDAHYLPRAKLAFAGGQEFKSPVFDAYSRNLTPDVNTGIGTWTDAEIMRAIRQGITREGDIIGPPMPIRNFNTMADDDVKALVAYLHTLKPIRHENTPSVYKIPLQPAPPPQVQHAPSRTDKVAYGSYIVNSLAHCFECHTPPGPDPEHHRGAGGFPFPVKPGVVVRSMNITPDKETGIGTWTDAQIRRAITRGKDKNGKQLVPIMPYGHFTHMTRQDVDDVIAYLHTIPPVHNVVPPNPTPKALGMTVPKTGLVPRL